MRRLARGRTAAARAVETQRALRDQKHGECNNMFFDVIALLFCERFFSLKKHPVKGAVELS
jgi:hypothetical protein